ncbi:MAG: trypsin-like serine protease [Cyanothece sp. SIO1E1]|nr:trypsin-like serine protease [Cyanothece sp. SIO1E1]
MSLSKQQFPHPQKVGIYALVLTLILGTALTFIILQLFNPFSSGQKSIEIEPQTLATLKPAAQTLAIKEGANTEHNFVAAAVSRVGSAVVRIDTERTVATYMPMPFLDEPFFGRFFGEDVFPVWPQEYRQRGQGSGFILDQDGLIITNAHVVNNADMVTVTLKDGRTFQGTVKGMDPFSDLAVIKIDGQNLPVVALGNSSEVQVGDWAIAVGNPLGLDNTVTLGIISTLNRPSAQVGIPDKRLEFMQTDAAINPGNSGGPLLNQRGEVIGINTAIRAEAEGIGFAIPIDTAKAIKDRLARGEKITYPFIGIQMVTLTPGMAKQLNGRLNISVDIPEIQGVLVLQVMPDSPAAEAQLQGGDVITAIDNQSVVNANQLRNAISNSQIGRPLGLQVQRGPQIMQISVRPTELPDATR